MSDRLPLSRFHRLAGTVIGAATTRDGRDLVPVGRAAYAPTPVVPGPGTHGRIPEALERSKSLPGAGR